MVFSIIYALVQYYYKFSTNGTILLYLIYPFTLYVMGYIVTNGKYKKMYQYLILVIVSFTLFGYLSLLNTVLTYGDMTSAIKTFGGQRLVMNFWDDSFITATGINTLLSFGLAMLPLVFLKDNKDKHNNTIRIMALLSFVAATYCVLQLGNRSGFAIIVLSFLVTTLFVRKASLKKVAGIFSTAFFLLIFKYLFDQNMFGLRFAWENTLLYARLQSTDIGSDSRVLAWKLTFNGLFENPMGGKETLIPLNYAHNLWLDVAFEGGFFPFAVLVLFTLISIGSIITFRRYNHPVVLKGIVIALFTAFIITFMVEPVIQGWFTYFNIFCFIVGMIQRQNFEYRREIANPHSESNESKDNAEQVRKRKRYRITW